MMPSASSANSPSVGSSISSPIPAGARVTGSTHPSSSSTFSSPPSASPSPSASSPSASSSSSVPLPSSELTPVRPELDAPCPAEPTRADRTRRRFRRCTLSALISPTKLIQKLNRMDHSPSAIRRKKGVEGGGSFILLVVGLRERRELRLLGRRVAFADFVVGAADEIASREAETLGAVDASL